MGHADWVRARLHDNGELTLNEPRLVLEEERGVAVHVGSVWAWLRRLGLSHKKTLVACERKRSDVRRTRRLWRDRRQPFMRRAAGVPG